MAGRRFLYLAVLLGCLVFYFAYGQWLAWLLLVAVAAVPWFSLVLSIPAILRFRVSAAGSDILAPGTETDLWLLGKCSLPMPPFKGKIRLRSMLTGQSWRYSVSKGFTPLHCGGICATVEKARICDYLGLFSFPAKLGDPKTILVRPQSVAVPTPPDLHRYIARSWKPKFGGGFAENHELRLYRPGDSVHQIHWKLSAKTGKLILREPMEPEHGRVLLRLDLYGTPEELDRKLGRLLWLGTNLLDRNIDYEIQCLTDDGCERWSVSNAALLQDAIDSILHRKSAAAGTLQDRPEAAAWQYYIGGGIDEA